MQTKFGKSRAVFGTSLVGPGSLHQPIQDGSGLIIKVQGEKAVGQLALQSGPGVSVWLNVSVALYKREEVERREFWRHPTTQ